MKAWMFFLLSLCSPIYASPLAVTPQIAALNFNRWYIDALKQDKSPLLKPDTLTPSVSKKSIEAIEALYSGDSNDKDMPDSDMFIKAQDWEEDWDHVSVISSDFDAVCMNIYIAFGKNKKHVVADCLVREDEKWKVRSATLITL